MIYNSQSYQVNEYNSGVIEDRLEVERFYISGNLLNLYGLTHQTLDDQREIYSLGLGYADKHYEWFETR